MITLEKMNQVFIGMKLHSKELREGTFNKDFSYTKRLRAAQITALEISHDMIHVMRRKQFKGYEDADFCFDVHLPENWKNHQFREFDSTSFKVGCRIKATLDLGMQDDIKILLTKEEAEIQMQTLGDAIQDAEVLLKMLEEHFK